MKLLLDTDVLLWWFGNSPRIKKHWSDAITDPNAIVYVSMASLFEIILKVRVGKLKVSLSAIEHLIDRNRFTRLAITTSHLSRLEGLPRHHSDPFDHLLIAQAIDEDAVLVSVDAAMGSYPVNLM